VTAHRAHVKETVAIVDCCRPGGTKIVDRDGRFPLATFNRRVETIGALAEGLKSRGVLDRVYYLHEGDPLIHDLSAKYFRGHITQTHDYGGCALMSYVAAFELVDARYVLHYDADMLLHQADGYDWAKQAVTFCQASEGAVAATPRTSPPFSKHTGQPDAPSLRQGRPYFRVDGGWKDDWFSTRCFLLDRERLTRYVPFMKGRLFWETMFVKYFNRGYPRSPEIMMNRRIGGSGGWRLNLESESAWLLHPHDKPPKYIEMLPGILEAVTAGHVPDQQRGNTEVNVDAWDAYLRLEP
jgi:hypothetical protein